MRGLIPIFIAASNRRGSNQAPIAAACKPPTRGPRGGATTISCLRCILPLHLPHVGRRPPKQALLAGLSSSLPIGQGCCCVGLPLRAILIQNSDIQLLLSSSFSFYLCLHSSLSLLCLFSVYPSFPSILYLPKAGSQRPPVDVHHTARLSTPLAKWLSTTAMSTSPRRRSG